MFNAPMRYEPFKGDMFLVTTGGWVTFEEYEACWRALELAEAHDTQPYPTAEAYERVCAFRTKWQTRAEEAERALEERDAIPGVILDRFEDAESKLAALVPVIQNIIFLLTTPGVSLFTPEQIGKRLEEYTQGILEP